MKRKLTWDEILGIVLFVVAAFFLAVSVFLCFCDDIWYDELFTMGLAGQPFGELISVTARDVHPPLYYMIVKLLSGPASLFESAVEGPRLLWQPQVAAAKLASVLPFLLCLLYGAVKVRRYFGLLAAGLFGFLVLAMPGLSGYTVEARMYGWGLFFVTAGMLHAYGLVTEGKGWSALTLYSLAACYTHYFACVGAVMIYAYLFLALWKKGRLKAEWKRFLIGGGLCALGYLPWILGVVTRQVGQVKEDYWIQPVTWRTMGGCVKFLFQPSFSDERLNALLAVVLFAAYSVLFALALVKFLKRRGELTEREKGIAGGTFEGGREKADDGDIFLFGCVGILLGIVVFGFAASLLIRPIFVYRYMLPALGLFWLAFALLISRWKDRKSVFVPVFLLFFAVGIRNYRAFYGEEMWKRVQMADAREVLSQIRKEDAVVFNFDQTQGVLSFYLSNDTFLWYGKPEELIVEMYPQNHPLVEGEFSDETGIASLKELIARRGRVWFFGSGNAREEIIEKWKKAGIDAEEKASVMVERYWFNLYHIKSSATE